MLRQRTGSVVCPACGLLVGVNDDKCLNCGRRNPGLWGFAPLLGRFGRDLQLTTFIMWACVGLYVATLVVLSNGLQTNGLMNLLAPSQDSLFLFGASGATPVFVYGRWWTVLSAGWLHGSLLHIVFNMMSLKNVAPAVEEFYGASRMAIIYLVSGVAGFVTSTLAGRYLYFIPYLTPGSFTVGASASILGLIGSLIYYGKRGGSRMVSDQAKTWTVSILIFGLFFPNIDNFAHLGGLAGGYFCARLLDPLHPERLDHLLVALAGFLLSAIAIAFSIFSLLDALRG